jgi:hypothetical protein
VPIRAYSQQYAARPAVSQNLWRMAGAGAVVGLGVVALDGLKERYWLSMCVDSSGSVLVGSLSCMDCLLSHSLPAQTIYAELNVLKYPLFLGLPCKYCDTLQCGAWHLPGFRVTAHCQGTVQQQCCTFWVVSYLRMFRSCVRIDRGRRVRFYSAKHFVLKSTWCPRFSRRMVMSLGASALLRPSPRPSLALRPCTTALHPLTRSP